MAERTVERLVAGLPWPEQQVRELHAGVLGELTRQGVPDPADRAYSAVMSAGAVYATAGMPCPSLETVMLVVRMGEQVLARAEQTSCSR